MVLLPATWRNVPEALVHGHWQILLAWRPMLVTSALTALTVWQWHRRAWALDWTVGLACMLGSVLLGAVIGAVLACRPVPVAYLPAS